ncbi:MAG: hypothetical protein EPN45_14860, partial [Rhizobiaceae bacterium]
MRYKRAPYRSENLRATLYGVVSLSLLLFLWIAATSLFGWIGTRVLPSPFVVVSRFADLMVDPFGGSTLLGHISGSLERWSLGVAAAVVLGIPIGVSFAWMSWFRAIVNPVFEVLRYIPPFAWVPIAILWFGVSTMTQASVVFIAAFPAIVINSQLGVQQVDGILI